MLSISCGWFTRKLNFSVMQAKFGIRFGQTENLEEVQKRFIDRYNAIKAHNALNSTWKLEINRFAHLAREELAKKSGILETPISEPVPIISNRGGRVYTPDSWDWRLQNNVLKPVQDQGFCSASWAFAAIGAIEAQMSILQRRYDKLSEQEVLDCVSHYCNNGNVINAYNHVKNNRGVSSAVQSPYAFLNGFIYSRTCPSTTPRVVGSALRTYISIPAAEDQIRSYVFTYGPVVATMYFPDDLYFYRSGVFTDNWNQCKGMSANQAVLIVGYGSENNEEFWIVRNSWGESQNHQ